MIVILKIYLFGSNNLSHYKNINNLKKKIFYFLFCYQSFLKKNGRKSNCKIEIFYSFNFSLNNF